MRLGVRLVLLYYSAVRSCLRSRPGCPPRLIVLSDPPPSQPLIAGIIARGRYHSVNAPACRGIAGGPPRPSAALRGPKSQPPRTRRTAEEGAEGAAFYRRPRGECRPPDGNLRFVLFQWVMDEIIQQYRPDPISSSSAARLPTRKAGHRDRKDTEAAPRSRIAAISGIAPWTGPICSSHNLPGRMLSSSHGMPGPFPPN